MFDYNKRTVDPLGNIVLVHKKTTTFRTWAPRGNVGWYIGPTLDHYQCVECYTPSTHNTRTAYTVEFILTVIPITNTNSEEYLFQSIADIIALLANPNPTVPSFSFEDNTQNAVKQIATRLNRSIPVPKSV